MMAAKIEKVDVLLITVVAEERDAVNAHKFEKKGDKYGRVFYESAITNIPTGYLLRVVHYNIGEAGTAEVASFMGKYLNILNPSFVFLVGVSAGFAEKDVNICDVLIAKQIIYYPRGKDNPDSFEPRPSYHKPSRPLVASLVAHSTSEWKSHIVSSEELKRSTNLEPMIRNGDVLCGESVQNNPEIKKQLLGLWPAALGLDMESHGVFVAIEDCLHPPPTAMIRGVMDSGEDKNDAFKKLAADIAAAFLISYLSSGVLPSRGGIEDPPKLGTSVEALKRAEELDIKRQLRETVDSILDESRTTRWEDELEKMTEMMIRAYNEIDKSDDISYRRDASATDLLYRDSLFELLTTAFSKQSYSKTTVVMKAIEKSFSSVVACLKDESFFSNWLADLNSFYKDHLRCMLDSESRPYYSRNLHEIVILCVNIYIDGMKQSLIMKNGAFTFEVGLDLAFDMMKEGIIRGREFHTSEDFFSSTTPFSVMVAPLMNGIVECADMLTKFHDMSAGVIMILDKVLNIGFALIEVYRDKDLLNMIDYAGLSFLLAKPYLIKSWYYPDHLRQLLDYDKKVDFGGVLSPITKCLEVKHSDFENYELTRLFDAVSMFYEKQMELYEANGYFIEELLIRCFITSSDESQLDMAKRIVMLLCSSVRKNRTWRDYFRPLALLGWLDQKDHLDEDLKKVLSEVIASLNHSCDSMKSLLQEAASWKKDVHGDYLAPEPSYDEWEINGAKRALSFL